MGSSVDDQSDCFGGKSSIQSKLLWPPSRTGQVPPPDFENYSKKFFN